MNSLLLAATVVGQIAFAGSSLEPNRYEPLPVGSIKAAGWLGDQMQLMTDGLCAHLDEYSYFLQSGNGWLKRGKGIGWEEQAYWLRSYTQIAILTGNKHMLEVTKKWMDAMAANADQDGWYGPQILKHSELKGGNTISDIWPHMVMNEAILAWWEYTGDEKWLKLVHNFLRWCGAQDDCNFIPSYNLIWEGGAKSIDAKNYRSWTWGIQVARAADILPAVYRVYEATGDEKLLEVSRRAYLKRERPRLFINEHTVNFAQLFDYGSLYSRQSHNASDRGSADFWYDLHNAAWGAMIPRQGFCADENVRLGCYDPRYGTETCTWGEFTRSFTLMGAFTGDTKWADRTEDVIFNWYPVAYTPGWKELHYITAANQVNCDVMTDHDYSNSAPQAPYSAATYRCCQHNGAMAFPEFIRHLVMRDGKDGLVFWMYAPHSGSAKVGNKMVSWQMTTKYPFDGKVELAVKNAEGVKLSFRVPKWAENAELKAGSVVALPPSAEGKWTLDFKSTPKFAHTRRQDAVMIEKGPLTYSVAIEPVMRRAKRPQYRSQDGEIKPMYAENDNQATGEQMVEVVAKTGQRWNWALDLDTKLEYRELGFSGNCFTYNGAPCEIYASARELPEWTLQDNQPAALQESPAYTTKPVERVRFIPMCCARSRVTVMPSATTDEKLGVKWQPTPAKTIRKDRPKPTGFFPSNHKK